MFVSSPKIGTLTLFQLGVSFQRTDGADVNSIKPVKCMCTPDSGVILHHRTLYNLLTAFYVTSVCLFI